jgi:hypothetical protein
MERMVILIVGVKVGLIVQSFFLLRAGRPKANCAAFCEQRDSSLSSRSKLPTDSRRDIADQPGLVAGEPDRQSILTILSQNGTATAIHVRDHPVAALSPDMRSAERAKHVFAFKDPGGGDGLAAGPSSDECRKTGARRTELCGRS